MEHETFWTLLRDPSHWEFELFLMGVFDGVIGMLIWPHLRKFFKHHQTDDNKLACLERRMQKLEELHPELAEELCEVNHDDCCRAEPSSTAARGSEPHLLHNGGIFRQFRRILGLPHRPQRRPDPHLSRPIQPSGVCEERELHDVGV